MTAQEGRPKSINQADFVRSLARGLLVIRSFDETHRSQTLSDVGRRTGLNRATARRLLLTLAELGYVRADNREYSLTPAVLQLGYAYLAALGVRPIAQPYLESLSEEVHESCSMTVLDGSDIVYVVRVPTKRILSLALSVGSRLPAYVTSMGRVLLSELPDSEVDEILGQSDLRANTEHTIVDPELIRAELRKARSQGWYHLEEELELGVQSIAAPVRDDTGRVIAAINISATVARTPRERVTTDFLPALLHAADQISAALNAR